MNANVARIMKDIRSLDSNEVDELLRHLQDEYVMPGDDSASVEAAWDAEIAERVKDVEEGRVELISGEESERRTVALFAKHGLQRRTA
jgi:hypothetical protein